MSYQTEDLSIEDGRPFYLYQFIRDGITYRYNSSTELVSLNGSDWAASSIDHGKIYVGQVVNKDKIDITFDSTQTLPQLLMKRETRYIPTSVTIWRGHHDDPDGATLVIFKGTVRATKPKGRNQIQVSCTSLFSAVEEIGLGAILHRSCRHVLYQGKCKLSMASHQTTVTLSSYTGVTVTLDADPAPESSYWALGVIEYNSRFIFILGQSGSVLTLRATPQDIIDAIDADGSVDVEMAPGCNRSIAQCRDRFSNSDNFGGFPYMPNIDPWVKGSVV